jgi:hypothetical protein
VITVYLAASLALAMTQFVDVYKYKTQLLPRDAVEQATLTEEFGLIDNRAIFTFGFFNSETVAAEVPPRIGKFMVEEFYMEMYALKPF